jgi:hypothetical protein
VELSWCQRLRLHADEVDYGGLVTKAVDAQCTRLIVLSKREDDGGYEVVVHQGCQGPGRIERFCDIIDVTTLTLVVDVCQDGGVLRRATIKCSLQIDVGVG